MDEQINPSADSGSVSIAKKLAVFALLSAVFIAVGTYPPLRDFLRPEALDRTVESMGWMGALLLIALGILTPLLMLPRWPIAVVSGMVYGVLWGTLLANTSSFIGATLQYWLARSTLAHLASRWLTGSRARWRRLLESREHAFSVLFLVRVFPLSNFIATNLLCGTIRMSFRTYLAASLLGMIPSTVLYAAWGKFMVKPSGGFMFLVFATLALLVCGTLYARRFLARASSQT